MPHMPNRRCIRNSVLHAVTISKITQVNESIRILRLDITDVHAGIAFIPGQWLDLYFEGLGKAGGYAILSTPSAATTTTLGNMCQAYQPYVELAVQNAPTPQVQRLWADVPSVAGTELMVRVGGSFVWPPTSLSIKAIRSVIFLAGGMGVNPLVSMASHMHETAAMPEEVHFLFASMVKGYYNVSNVLGLERLLKISNARRGQFHLNLFFSGHPSRVLMEEAVPRQRFEPRRVLDGDVLGAFRNVELNASTVCYVCGPHQMTDHFVELVRRQVGLEINQVFYETAGDSPAEPLHGYGSNGTIA